MKKLLSMLLACALLVSCVPAMASIVNPVPYPETGVLFHEDFSDYDVADNSETSVSNMTTLNTNWNYTNTNYGGYITNNNSGHGVGDPCFYWGTLWYQVPANAGIVNTGVIEYSFDMKLRNCADPSRYDVSFEKSNVGHHVFTAVKTGNKDAPDGALKYYFSSYDHTGTNASASTNPIVVDGTLENWANIKIKVDFSEGSVEYYVDNIKVGGWNGNVNCYALSNYIGFINTAPTNKYLYLDNFKIERFKKTIEPEKQSSYSINGTVPATGLIMKETFDGISETKELSKANGGIFYGGITADIVNVESNKHIKVTGNNAYLAYELCKHLTTQEDISSGQLALSYKVMVPKCDEEMTSGKQNLLAMCVQSHAGWWGDATTATNGRAYLNSVCYGNTNPYVQYATTISGGGFVSDDTSADVKVTKNIAFDTWYTIKVVIDYDNNVVKQYLDNECVCTVNYADSNENKLKFDVMQLTKRKDDNENSNFGICMDDWRIERLDTTTVASSTKITKGGTELTKSDVASLAGTELSVNFTAASSGKGNVVVAAYKGNELIGIVCSLDNTLKAGENSVSVTASSNFNGADTVKAFVFDNFNNMYPVADAAEYLAN